MMGEQKKKKKEEKKRRRRRDKEEIVENLPDKEEDANENHLIQSMQG